MEILNERAHEWSLKAICTGENRLQKRHLPCGSELLIKPHDVLKTSYCPDYGSDITYGFICPVCGCFTEIANENIPDPIKSACTQFDSE